MSDTPSPSAGSTGSDDAALHDTSFFGHPRGLRTLFFTEMWERFSYYGMRAILVLFMTASLSQGGLGFTPSKAGPIYALYTSMVFLSTVPGGWIADNFLGAQRAVFSGGILIMIGHVLLAMHGLPFFYGGLAFVVLGTGLLKPCISSIVGELYSKEDARRDAGFSIFYMGINIGAFTAPLVCGYLAESTHFSVKLEEWGLDPKNSWHWGFAAAAVGMFFGLVQYALTSKNLGDAGFPDRKAWLKALGAADPSVDLTRVGIYGGSAGGQNAMRALIDHNDVYSVAVADCGCHDNRMDKIWWNELWMSWPVGPHYIQSSNVEQAHRTEGKLLLIVGELDRNVDPASTMQVVDALVRADKDFDLLVIPGTGHGAAETPYGRRRRTDFLVRHLMGVEPRWW